MTGLVRGERQPIQVRPQAMLEARDLPKCDISDFLQSRIDTALQNELVQRAKEQGVPPKQVRQPESTAHSACLCSIAVSCTMFEELLGGMCAQLGFLA